MKKKFIILLLCFIVLLAFISCNKGNEETDTKPTVKQEVAETSKTPETNEVKETSKSQDTVVVAAPGIDAPEDEIDNTNDATGIEENENVENETSVLVDDNQDTVETAVVKMNSYEFSFMNAKVKTILDNGVATIDYPTNITEEEIANGLSYIELILDVNPSAFTFAYSKPGEVVVTYPNFISDEDLIEGFKIGLEYYLPYAKYDKFNFTLYGMPVYVGIKDGNAIVIYPKNFNKNEVSGILDLMLSNPEAVGFDYSIVRDRVVSITYPSTIEENTLIEGFTSLLNKSILEFFNEPEEKIQPAEEEVVISMPVKTGNSYDFTLLGAQVKATLDSGEATVTYPKGVSNAEIAKGLEYIGRELNANSSDFTYSFVMSGKVVITYPVSLTDDELIEGFTTGLNLYLNTMKKVEPKVEVKDPVTDVKAIEVKPQAPIADDVKTIEVKPQAPVVATKPTKKDYKEEFVKNYQNFEFYIEDVFVEGKVSEKDVIFTYDSAYDVYLEKELVKIASTMTAYKTSDFTYDVHDGKLTFTYSEDINPNEAIDAFFAEIFSL